MSRCPQSGLPMTAADVADYLEWCRNGCENAVRNATACFATAEAAYLVAKTALEKTTQALAEVQQKIEASARGVQ